jgi:hypothetical protein
MKLRTVRIILLGVLSLRLQKIGYQSSTILMCMMRIENLSQKSGSMNY